MILLFILFLCCPTLFVLFSLLWISLWVSSLCRYLLFNSSFTAPSCIFYPWCPSTKIETGFPEKVKLCLAFVCLLRVLPTFTLLLSSEDSLVSCLFGNGNLGYLTQHFAKSRFMSHTSLMTKLWLLKLSPVLELAINLRLSISM